ncbi:MAG: ATP-binding protein, partial [Candidatus Binatia bacterium]
MTAAPFDAGAGGGDATHEDRPPRAGRAQVAQRMRQALHDVLGGSGRLVLLAGEPGAGKTHAAEALARQAREGGANIAWGRCWAEEGAPE